MCFPCSFFCKGLLLFEGNVKDGSSKQQKTFMTNDKQWNTFKNLKSIKSVRTEAKNNVTQFVYRNKGFVTSFVCGT